MDRLSAQLDDTAILGLLPKAELIELVGEKQKEWQELKEQVEWDITFALLLIKHSTQDKWSRYFWLKVYEVEYTPILQEVDKQLLRLKRLQLLAEGKDPETPQDKAIQRARTVPIPSIANDLRFHKVGSRYKARCPFHQDRYPSMTIYPDNKFYCFGCQAHGDAITFAQRYHKLGFADAVKLLGGAA